MGRLQYLERMALGRSAFQPATPPPGSDTEGQSNPESPPDRTTSSPKSRPFNPETAARNAALRHAQNDLLALVGVVERNDLVAEATQLQANLKRKRLDYRYSVEDDMGMAIELGAEAVSYLAMWWPHTLLRRVLAGIYDDRASFAEIISAELLSMRNHGIGALFSGFGLAAVREATSYLLVLLLAEGTEQLQNKIIRSRLRRRHAKRLVNTLYYLDEAILVAIDWLLSPLSLLSLASQLNLHSPPPWRTLLRSTLPALTRSTLPNTLTFTSPTPHLTLLASLHRLSTPETFWHPAPAPPTTPSLQPPPPPVLSSSLTASFALLSSTRQNLLTRLFGWTVSELAPPGPKNGWETDLHISEHADAENEANTGHVSTHRSTALARLPAAWLGARIDNLLWMAVTLPLEGVVMRRVAGWWLGRGSERWDWGRYVSHVGLAVGVNLVVEAVLFAGVYGLVRWRGVVGYGWQRRGREEG